MINGLTDRVDIFRYTVADDGAGGEIIDDEDTIYTNTPARITLITGDSLKQLRELGFTGKELWRVMMEYCSELVRIDGDLYLRLNYSAPESVILPGVNYRVLRNRRQRDDLNVSHHTSLIIEKDEST